MAFADTQRLIVDLSLTGSFRPGIQAAERSLAGFGAAATKISAPIGKFGGALSHAASQLKNLALGPLGLIGITGGLLTFGGAIEKGIGRAQEFGDEVRRMAALTGLSVETTSALASAFDHFNIGADQAIRLTGFLEKNIGLLAARKGAIEDFQKTFGLAFTDQNGKIKDANELILTTADYFTNKSIPATTKAAALAKIYGRSWQELIPFLSAGRQGIKDAEEEAAALGLTLSAKDIPALRAMKEATRTWGDALGGLELQIGLALLPSLTDLAKSATSFVRDNRTQIVGFFRDGAKFAGELGDAIVKYVVPAIRGIAGAWGALPEGVKQFLIGGAIVGKTTKFLFDVGPLDIAKDVAGGLAGALAKAGIGKAFVQPVFVTNQALPGAPGGGGGGGIIGAARSLLFFLGAVELATIAVDKFQNELVPLGSTIDAQTKKINTQIASALPTESLADLQKNLSVVNQEYEDLTRVAGPFSQIFFHDQIDAAKRNIDAINAEIDTRHMALLGDERNAQAAYLAFDRLEGAANPLSRTLDELTSAAARATQAWREQVAKAMALLGGKSFKLNLGEFAKGTSDLSKANILLLADTITGKFERSNTGYFGDVRKQRSQLARLVDLQEAFRRAGDTKSADAIGRDIARMKADLSQREREVAAEVRRKKLAVGVKVGVTATAIATISAREGVKATATIYKYGSVTTGGGPMKLPI